MAAIIELKSLYKTFGAGENQVNALKNVSVSVEKGDIFGIIGVSGAGKSTLVRCINLLERPTEGEVFINGKNVTAMTPQELRALRRKVTMIFQGFNLLSRTSALENVELPMVYAKVPAEERAKRAAKALKSDGLASRMDHQPNQLSGGQQQRVAIARAIVNEAPIIFADEPTGNLDTKMSGEIMELFTKLNRDLGRTIILVTHEEDIARYSDRIIKIVDGEIHSDAKVEK